MVKISKTHHQTRSGQIKKNPKKKSLYTTEDYFSFSDLRSAPIIESKAYGSMNFPQEKKIISFEKPVRRIGHFKDMFKHGDYIEIINPRRNFVAGTVKDLYDGTVLLTSGDDKLLVSETDDLYYEEWLEDNGSILFLNPKNPGGNFLKLMTEGDTIRVVRYDGQK